MYGSRYERSYTTFSLGLAHDLIVIGLYATFQMIISVIIFPRRTQFIYKSNFVRSVKVERT